MRPTDELVEHYAKLKRFERRMTAFAGFALAVGLLSSLAGVWWCTRPTCCDGSGIAVREVDQLQRAIEMHMTREEGRCPVAIPALARTGLTTIFRDPWGNRYAFRCSTGFTPYVVSAGADGRFGTNDDIDNLRVLR